MPARKKRQTSNIHRDNPICVELRVAISYHNIRLAELGQEAAMSAASVGQYRNGYRVPQLHVMENLRASIDRIVARRAETPRIKEYLAEINSKKYMIQFKNDIWELAVANDWSVMGLHDLDMNEVGLIINREILIMAFLRARRHRMPEATARAKAALEATDLNDLPAIRAGLAHPKIASWEWSPDDWPAIHRILTHPMDQKPPARPDFLDDLDEEDV